MSFFAAGSAIAGALGAGAVGSAVAGAGAALVGGKLVNKVSSGSSSGSVGQLPNQQLDINKIIEDARLAAANNYKNSLALEAAQNPGQADFRNAATAGVTALANADPYSAPIPGRSAASYAPGYTPVAARTYSGAPQTAYTGTEQGNSLLSESADSILQSLRLGGALPADVQSQITRAALSKGAQAGLSGSAASRGLVARDIGTNSLALLTARQQQALQAGGLLEQIGLGRAQFGLDQSRFGLDADRFGLDADRFGLQQAAFGLDQARFGLEGDRFGLDQAQLGLAQDQYNTNRALQLKSLADAYGLPESGLSSGAIASLYVGENNALNQTNQNQFLIDQQNANRRADQLNKLLGFGSQALTSALEKKKTGTQ